LRPSGLVADSNACSVLIIFFMGLAFLTRTYLNRGKWVGRGYYAAGVVLILLTISRTGIISLVIFAAIPFMQSKRKLKALGASLLATIVFGGLALLYLQSTKTLSAVVEQAQLVLFSSDQRQESSSIHFQLLAKGTTEFFGNAKTFLLGAGWGTEYDFTKEFFADSKNGNFHNDFISIAVQTGIAGLACFLFLIAKPLLLRMEWKPLTVIVLWSSMFCQYHGNPFWWIAIMIMSTSLASRRRRRGIPMPALSRSGQLVSSSHMVKISIEGS